MTKDRLTSIQAQVTMRKSLTFLIALTTLAACDASRRTEAIPTPVTAANADSVFAAMDHRHGDVVGVDPMALAHRFEALPDGGSIVLEREAHDDFGISQIRLHLLKISRSFKRGDFSLPGFIHAQAVPGSEMMAERSGKIDYVVEDLPHGGAIYIRTSDPEALRAVHSFIAFQIAEHKTAK